MRLLNAIAFSAGSLTHEVQPGMYGKFCIRYNLDAGAGITLTLANMGSLILNWNGKDVLNIPISLLSYLNNTYGGTATFSAAAGGATSCIVFVPCGLFWDNMNVYHISSLDKVFFKLDFPDLIVAGNVDSGTIAIYGKHKLGIMNYLYNILRKPVVFSGASDTQADNYPANNVSALYIENPALISNIQISKDAILYADAPTAVIQAENDWIHQLETSISVIAMEFGESKDIRENAGGNVHYQYLSTGAGTLNQFFGFLTYTPEKASESGRVANEKLNQQQIQVPIIGTDINRDVTVDGVRFPSGRVYKLGYANVSVPAIDKTNMPSGYKWISTSGGLALALK